MRHIHIPPPILRPDYIRPKPQNPLAVSRPVVHIRIPPVIPHLFHLRPARNHQKIHCPVPRYHMKQSPASALPHHRIRPLITPRPKPNHRHAHQQRQRRHRHEYMPKDPSHVSPSTHCITIEFHLLRYMTSIKDIVLTTPRLTLRPWRESDLAPFAAMNADPRVMRHFPKTLTAQESDATVQYFQNHFVQHGFSLFAVERTATGDFLGFVGLAIPSFQSH